ncbi:MAG: VWA domain-containing protein, partial [Gammaproteobacteria bacterium]|nr:VWA domain-containing protein [Gammaproteobacteria bacterium]
MGGSLRASREGIIRGVASLGKETTLPGEMRLATNPFPARWVHQNSLVGLLKMNDTVGLHFSEPLWLLALFAPLLLWWWPQAKKSIADLQRLERYAERHLLPHLLKGTLSLGRSRRRLILWSLLWVLGVVAMAGPRLGFTEVGLYTPGTNLVILLDLSRSMDAADVKPSRLVRARQEVEDLLDRNPGLRIGLIAFASVSHVVAPITEDGDTLRHLLPSISTDLAQWKGSRLSSALERARRLISGQPKDSSHALLLISDGDFSEPGLEKQMRFLRDM